MDEFNQEFEVFIKTDIKFSNKHCVQYMGLESYNNILDIALKFFNQKKINFKEYDLIKRFSTMLYQNYLKHGFQIKKRSCGNKRMLAQYFIGKKNIRKFIFNRDKACLCCGSYEKLSIDHIKAVSNGGENKISNLQTLCKSCNSRKSDKYIDYRK